MFLRNNDINFENKKHFEYIDKYIIRVVELQLVKESAFFTGINDKLVKNLIIKILV